MGAIIPLVGCETAGEKWGFSSAGRASALQAEGHRFEPCSPHQNLVFIKAGFFVYPMLFRALCRKSLAASVAQWQSVRFPSRIRGSDSRHSLHKKPLYAGSAYRGFLLFAVRILHGKLCALKTGRLQPRCDGAACLGALAFAGEISCISAIPAYTAIRDKNLPQGLNMLDFLQSF